MGERGPTEGLGDVLVKKALLTPEQLEDAQRLQKKYRLKLHEALIQAGAVTEDDLVKGLVDHLGHPYVDVTNHEIQTEAIQSLEKRICIQHTILPLSVTNGVLHLAMTDPLDIEAIDLVSRSCGLRVEPFVAKRSSILDGIEMAYARASGQIFSDLLKDLVNVKEETEEPADPSGGADLRQIDVAQAEMWSKDGAIIQLVNHILGKAIEMRASDVHIEPFERRIRVRYRVDGDLRTISDDLPKESHRVLVSRIKILSKMKIDESRRPQDARVRILFLGRPIDLRVSSLPTCHGEKVVLRILDREHLDLDLRVLGFEDQPLDVLLKALRRPYGMVLVTGPTGSGKTTTLYSALAELNGDKVNISTAEDPIEYQIDGISQAACQPDIGLTFPVLLRTFLRQDPDIIMVGEIRDGETANIAVKAALTGHLVLSTLHTNTAASAVARLEDMGVEPFMVGLSLAISTAQRLMKALCPKCKESWHASPGLLDEWGVAPEERAKASPYRANGCQSCSRGYRGRSAVMEAFSVTEAISDLIVRRAPLSEIQALAVREGMTTLRQNAIAKMLRGITSWEEVARIATD